MESYGGSESSSSSAMAPLSCHDFLERMRHPSAADLVKSIKSFIVSLSNKASDPDKDSAAVQEFLSRMEEAFRSHSLWAGSSEEELESAAEGLEKYLMTKIYSRAFATPQDVKQDEELFEKIMLVQQFVRPENLEIKPTFQNETSWLLAQKELQKINMYKAPRDKLVCILNCCKVINNLLLNASISSSDNPPGADEFLPVLIYVTIKANPPQLHSNLLYIQRYRQQSRLVSEAAYYFTNILSAESFIWNIDAKALSMDELEFQQSMESARAVLLGLSTDSGSHENRVSKATPGNKVDTSKTKSDTNDYVRGQNPDPQAYDLNDMGQKITNRPSVADIEKQGTGDLLKDEQPNRYFFNYPFLYARAGDLTVGDIDTLLNSYKQLVLKYVSLSKGMGVSNMSPTVDTMQTEAKLEASMNSEHIREMEMDNEKQEGLRSTDNNSDGSLFMSKSEGNLLISLIEDKPKVPEDDSTSGRVAEKDEEFK